MRNNGTGQTDRPIINCARVRMIEGGTGGAVHAPWCEDFQQGIPASWTLFNVDGLTPHASVSFVNNAWVARADGNTQSTTDTAAVSTSWYSPVGTADDWLITPLLALGANDLLSWSAVATDVNFADGYEVRVSTTTATTAAFMSNAALMTVAAENQAWTDRNINLAAMGYANQDVFIAFRNNSIDKFLLYIDDVCLSEVQSHDAAVIGVDTFSEYTQIPLDQTRPLMLGATVENLGAQAVTGVFVTADVMDGSGSVVHTVNSTPLATLAPTATNSFTLPSWTPTTLGTYQAVYSVHINETDVNAANDTDSSFTLGITDSTFARDDGVITGSLGIGAGTPGQLGQTFNLVQPAELTSVTFFLNNPSAGEDISVSIYSVTDTPVNLLGTSIVVPVPVAGPQTITLPIAGGPLQLPAGDFALLVEEGDSNITLGYTNNIFTAGATWVNFTGSPIGWGNNEDFGFSVTYVLRANFGEAESCEAPEGLYTDKLKPFSARAHWAPSSNAYRYQIRGRNVNNANWFQILLPIGGPELRDFLGLGNNTTYVWQVRTWCDAAGSDISPWSVMDTFTTGCYAPDSTWESIVTSNGARLDWTKADGAVGYEIKGRKIGGTLATIFIGGGNTLLKDVAGLLPATTYEWVIRTYCDVNGVKKSDFTAFNQFTTSTGARLAGVTDPFGSPDDVMVSVHPNPFADQFSISLSNETENVEIEVTDLVGKTRLIENYNSFAESSFAIEGEAGVYFVTIRIGGQIHAIHRMVKQ